MRPLADLRVADFSAGIAGGYAGKLLADAGAQVTKVEVGRDPVRDRTPRGHAEPSALYLHLNADKLPGGESSAATVAGEAEIVIVGSDTSARLPDATESVLRDLDRTRARVIVQISPFGRTGPEAGLPATEFTMQARSGKLAMNAGGAGGTPMASGGEPGLWLAGTFAALLGLGYLRLARSTGRVVDVDLSILESMVAVFGQDFIGAQLRSAAGVSVTSTGSTEQIPATHRARDGQVSFAVVTAQHWSDFCVLIERPEWGSESDLLSAAGRRQRRAEVVPAIDAWVASHTVREVLEAAALLRIPTGPVTNGETAPLLDCYADSFVLDHLGFLRPGPSIRFGQSPTTDHEHRAADEETPTIGRPLEGLTILDTTAFWAGPYAGDLLALMGADVLHVEGPQRPDGMRTMSVQPASDPTWLEWGPVYHANNGSKSSASIDLGAPDARPLVERLISRCDGMIENFSPRVMDQFGLHHGPVRALNPSIIYVRMPAFGLENPWRDRSAFQHTIEPLAGLSWISGAPDGQPQPIMICDGLGGVHAAFGLLCGLYQRDRTGSGVDVEVRLSEVAAAIAAEQTVTASATGVVLRRIGNRSRWGIVQGVYRTASADPDDQSWVALSADTVDQWRDLCSLVGVSADEAPDATLVDRLERALTSWCAQRDAASAVAELQAGGIPAARVAAASQLGDDPQLRDRQFLSTVSHPVCGPLRYFGLPAVVSVDSIGRVPVGHYAHAPMWGEHNSQLTRWADITQQELTEMTDSGVVGVVDLALSPM